MSKEEKLGPLFVQNSHHITLPAGCYYKEGCVIVGEPPSGIFIRLREFFYELFKRAH